MSFTALSLTAIPAATGLAREVADVGERMGQGFLSMLSNMGASRSLHAADGGNATAHGPAKLDLAAGNSDDKSSTALASKTKAWCERFMNWLGKTHSQGELNIELSLDALDQPQVTVTGDDSEKMGAAIAANPVWLQEFRELALDRSGEQGQPPPGAPQAPPPRLSISQRDGQLTTAWQ